MNELETARQCAAVMLEKDSASRALGIAVEINAAGSATTRMTVTEAMLNGFAVCHGGHIFALADTAFAFACNAYNKLTVAAGADIDFLRPAYAGDKLTAVAKERSRGGRTGIYDVTVRNQDAEEVAVFRGRSYSTGKSILPDPSPK